MTELSLKVFCSYSHKDESLREELDKHLSPFIHSGLISTWSDRKILPGEVWDDEIKNNLKTADIILLLISADFLASKYCWEVEVNTAIERHKAKKACVIPIILRSVYWKYPPLNLAQIQALPKNATPVESRDWHNRDEAFTNVVEGIWAAVEKLNREREERQQQQEAQRLQREQEEAEKLRRQQEAVRSQRLQREQEEADRLQREQEAERLRQQKEAEQQEAYANNLSLYEQEFSRAVKAEYPISEYVRNGLKQFQQSLKLRDEDVTRVEKTILAPLQEAERIRKQQEAESLQRQQQEAERLKRQQQQETEKLRLKREQEEAKRRLQETDDLSSDKGVDYRQLRDLLKAGKWKEADQETLQVMLKVADKEKEGWLDIDSIKKFPCTDLRTIDQLWVKYSNGRFGFSVQKKIWLEVGEKWNAFYTRVGWQVSAGWFFGGWVKEGSIKHDLNAPVGHLPGVVCCVSCVRDNWLEAYEKAGWYLFSRVQTCKL